MGTKIAADRFKTIPVTIRKWIVLIHLGISTQTISLEAAVRRCSSKYVFLKILRYSQDLFSKVTPTQMFLWQYCEIFKNNFFYILFVLIFARINFGAAKEKFFRVY